jgi:hypothetical protein
MGVLTLIMLGRVLDNIKTSAKENIGYQKLKHKKPWFDDECSKLIDQRKLITLLLRVGTS